MSPDQREQLVRLLVAVALAGVAITGVWALFHLEEGGC